MDFQTWRHVFKLDPAKQISDGHLERICESGTDAILIGGSDDVTLDNVLELMARVRRYSVPVALEVSTVESVTPGFDYYFIPTVLNSSDPKWIKGLHHEAIREYGEIMDWTEIVPEGYCILNPDCKAARLTGADASLTEEDVLGYARMAEHFSSCRSFIWNIAACTATLNSSTKPHRCCLRHGCFTEAASIQWNAPKKWRRSVIRSLSAISFMKI